MSGQISAKDERSINTFGTATKSVKKQCGSKDKRGQTKNRVSIDERPVFVEQKKRIGDWEIDTVIGQNQKRGLGDDSGLCVQVHLNQKG